MGCSKREWKWERSSSIASGSSSSPIMGRDHQDVLDDFVFDAVFGLVGIGLGVTGRREGDRLLALTVIGMGDAAFSLQPAGNHLLDRAGSALSRPAASVQTTGPIWMRSPSRSSVSASRRVRPSTIVPFVLPRSRTKIRPSRSSIAE